MPKQVQFRRGTEEQNNNFTGASGEISINDTNNSLRVHDGSTIGGHELAKKNLSNVSGVGSFSANKVTTTSIQSQNSNISGISTLGTVIVSSGIISAVSGVVTYYGDGSNLFGVSASKWQTTSSGIHTLSNVGIGTTNPTSTLTVAGTGLFTGIVTASNLNISGTSTLGTVQISSGIVTATTGIITYYGDGSKLSNIVTGSSSSSQWVTTSAGIHTLSNVGIGTTNPIQSLQVGAAGTTVVVVDSLGEVGIGTTNPTAKLHVVGDINLDDGGTYTTTFQTITPTANRTISLPDATGTVALVAGSSAQLIYNNAGTYAGITSVTFDGNLNLATRFINTLNGAASAPPESLTGTWFSGGTGTTTKPQLLVEPSGTTSTAWNTAGTGLGINAASGFTGLLLDLQLNGTSNFRVDSTGRVSFPLGTAALPSIYPGTDTNTGIWSPTADTLAASTNGTEAIRITSGQNVGINTNNPSSRLHVIGTVTATSFVGGGATKTFASFSVRENQPSAANFATLNTRNSISVLEFDDTTQESANFISVIPEGANLSSGILVRIWWMGATATTGNVRWGASFEASGTDLDADSFDTVTEVTSAANATSGIETVAQITCTAIDSLTAGSRFRLRIARIAADATNDTMTGDAQLVAVEVRGVA